MHIALVVPGGVDRGGRERVIPALLWLIEELARTDDVTVVALGQEPRATTYPLLGAQVVNVPPEQPGPLRLARMVARGVTAVGRDGRPGVVHGLWASVSGLVAVAAARRFGAPSVVHVAGGELVALPDIGYGGALGRGGRLISRTCLRGATAVTVATEWMGEHVRASGYRVDHVIPLGVDITRFHPAETLTAASGDHLVHVGSLNRVKDQAGFLRAVALIAERRPQVSAELIGVDTLHGELAELAARLGIADRVRFAGFVASDQLAPHYQAATVHVVSSRHEAGPVAVLEAAACALPTVGTAVGHVADLAALDPPGAIAVPPADPAALADAVVALLGDRDRRAAMAATALAFARANDRVATAAKFRTLYSELATRRR